MARYSGNKSYYDLFPDSNDRTKFQLTGANSDSSLLLLPYSFVHSGSMNNGEKIALGNYGYYWIGTIQSSEQARMLYFYKTLFYSQSRYPKHYGLSLRCVAKSPLLFLKQARSFSPTLFRKIQNFSSRLCERARFLQHFYYKKSRSEAAKDFLSGEYVVKIKRRDARGTTRGVLDFMCFLFY